MVGRWWNQFLLDGPFEHAFNAPDGGIDIAATPVLLHHPIPYRFQRQGAKSLGWRMTVKLFHRFKSQADAILLRSWYVILAILLLGKTPVR